MNGINNIEFIWRMAVSFASITLGRTANITLN